MKHLNRLSEKLKEADFFLEKMGSINRHADELNYYFSAFASAARSVTFVLKYILRFPILHILPRTLHNVSLSITMVYKNTSP